MLAAAMQQPEEGAHFVVVAVAPRYQLCAAVVAEVAVLLMAARLPARYYVCCVYALFIDAFLAQQHVVGGRAMLSIFPFCFCNSCA